MYEIYIRLKLERNVRCILNIFMRYKYFIYNIIKDEIVNVYLDKMFLGNYNFLLLYGKIIIL